MNEIHDDVRDLLDEYVDGVISAERLQELETRLQADADLRRFFIRYCRLHTDLSLDARAQQVATRALENLPNSQTSQTAWRRWLVGGAGLVAAMLLIAFGLWLWQRETPEPRQEAIAWLVNAQNCQWAQDMAPEGDMQAGKLLRLERGLAEIRFQQGARIVIEGPAHVEIRSANSARLQQGKLSAKVPESAKGFQVITPKGKIVDLGTEFAMAVEDDGTTDVYVYSGKVEAYGDAKDPAKFLSVQEKQAARIDRDGVTLKANPPLVAEKPFMRDIPVIVPRVFTLDFQRAIDGTLGDSAGLGVGLTERLPGTGRRLKPNDANLALNLAQQQLELTTTNSDLNTQYQLDQGEYLGIKLKDLGYTGSENFALTVVVPNIPALQKVGQFGLYAGTRSDFTIRGGLLSRKEPEQYRQFLVQNQAGKDAPPHFVGLTTPGDDLRLTLRREGKQYSLTVENLTDGNSSTLTMTQPAFLEGRGDLYAGFFGANTQSEVRRTLVLKEFKVTVWTTTP